MKQTAFKLLALISTILMVQATLRKDRSTTNPISYDESDTYTSFEDASWAITKVEGLSNKLGNTQQVYDNFMQGCKDASPPGKEFMCEQAERERIDRNVLQPPSVFNYTKEGFKKVKAPEKVFQLVKDFWEANKHRAKPEFRNVVTPYHNSWESPPDFLPLSDPKLEGGGEPLLAAISNAARDILQEWTGQVLAPSSVYGIRIYHNQSTLAPHVDRVPLICSAILNVDQDVDEGWVLEAYDHDGVAHNVSMAPGEMVLYESHSVIHGRPFPMNGRQYANVFIHFEPLGDITSKEELPPKGSLPPYIVEGTEWAEWYKYVFPNGWDLLNNIQGLVRRGDLNTLRYMAQRDRHSLAQSVNATENLYYLHMAVEFGHLDVTEFFLDEIGIDANTPLLGRATVSPLDIALHRFKHDESHPMVQLLKKHGGKPIQFAKPQQGSVTSTKLSPAGSGLRSRPHKHCNE